MNLSKLDKVFSEFIRLRDADENGLCPCVYCKHTVPWKSAEACHFIDRRHLSTRFDERNVNAGCFECNRTASIFDYAENLTDKHGPRVIEELTIKHRQTVKLSQADIDRLTEHYKDEVRKLKAEKGL